MRPRGGAGFIISAGSREPGADSHADASRSPKPNFQQLTARF